MFNKVIVDNSAVEYAKNNLNETETKRKDYVKEIRKWFDDNPNLNGNKDEEAIIPFLRGCKYDLEKTKKKLSNYYQMKRDVPEWFANRDPSLPILQELTKLGVFVPLKDDHEGKTIVILRIAGHNPRLHKIEDVIKVGLMILDLIAMENELMQIYGVIAIFDLENISFDHARQMTPTLIRRLVTAWENYHCRPKQLEFLNGPFYLNVILKIFKSFMSEKLKRRIRVHPYGVQYASSIVPSSILPIEYGGNAESIVTLSEYWAQKLLTHKDWFKMDEYYKIKQ